MVPMCHWSWSSGMRSGYVTQILNISSGGHGTGHQLNSNNTARWETGEAETMTSHLCSGNSLGSTNNNYFIDLSMCSRCVRFLDIRVRVYLNLVNTRSSTNLFTDVKIVCRDNVVISSHRVSNALW